MKKKSLVYLLKEKFQIERKQIETILKGIIPKKWKKKNTSNRKVEIKIKKLKN